MSEFKKGDIIVSLKEQTSSDRTNPFPIREGFIGENMSPEDGKVVWFKDTPPAKGSYKAKNFREATNDEKNQYIKGKTLVEPECPFEEGDYITTLKSVNTVSTSPEPWSIPEGATFFIDGIVKNPDPTKSVMYFEFIIGYYNPNEQDFRYATDEEIEACKDAAQQLKNLI